MNFVDENLWNSHRCLIRTHHNHSLKDGLFHIAINNHVFDHVDLEHHRYDRNHKNAEDKIIDMLLINPKNAANKIFKESEWKKYLRLRERESSLNVSDSVFILAF